MMEKFYTKLVFVFAFLVLSLFEIERNLVYAFYSFSVQTNHVHLNKEKKDEKKKELEELFKKAKNPDQEYENTMKKLIKKFFSGTGLKILTAICIFLCLFFFFRVRNYLVAIIFYILGSFFMFFGPYIADFLLK